MIAAQSPGHLVVANGQVAGSGPYVYVLARSDDDGRHWTRKITKTELVPSVQTDPAPSLSFPTPQVGHWMSGSSTLWTTINGGATWRPTVVSLGR